MEKWTRDRKDTCPYWISHLTHKGQERQNSSEAELCAGYREEILHKHIVKRISDGIYEINRIKRIVNIIAII